MEKKRFSVVEESSGKEQYFEDYMTAADFALLEYKRTKKTFLLKEGQTIISTFGVING